MAELVQAVKDVQMLVTLLIVLTVGLYAFGIYAAIVITRIQRDIEREVRDLRRER